MGKEQLLELGFLTDDEKAKLMKVLAADENLQKTQGQHFVKKHKDLYSERKQCITQATEDPSICPLCFIKFGWFTNTGEVCPIEACQLKVCNACRQVVGETWICMLCHKEKDLKAQAGYWFQQPSKNKKRVKTGTDILKKSLDTTVYSKRGGESPSLLALISKDPSPVPNTLEQEVAQVEAVQVQQQSSSAHSSTSAPYSAQGRPESPSTRSSNSYEPVQSNHVPEATNYSNHTTQNNSSYNCNIETAPEIVRHPTVPAAPPANHSTDYSVDNKKTLKAPHIRDIKGQSISADSGFINDCEREDNSTEAYSEDEDDRSGQLQRYLTARSVAPDELAPPHDTPPATPLLEKRPIQDGQISATVSSSNISCESISPSPTMIKANTKDRHIQGELLVGLGYSDKVNTLDVYINEGRNLQGVDGTPPHCYIKTYLLPDRSKTAKRKTKTKKKNSNPVYNEIFQYKASEREELASMTLWLTAWDSRQLGHNMFLGEVRVQLSSVNLNNSEPVWWPLQHMEDSHFRGSILLGLMYCPAADEGKKKKKTSIKLKVQEARDLPPMDNGKTNPYAALYLIPKTDSKDHKYKLQMRKNTTDPKWNAEVAFNHLDNASIEDQGVEIQILHLGKIEKAKQCVLIGVVRLCTHKTSIDKALDGRGIEVVHWKEALSKPGIWVEKWHNLRSWE